MDKEVMIGTAIPFRWHIRNNRNNRNCKVIIETVKFRKCTLAMEAIFWKRPHCITPTKLRYGV